MNTLGILLKTAMGSFCLGAISTGSFAVICEIGSRLTNDKAPAATQRHISPERQKLLADLIDQGLTVDELLERMNGRL